MMLVLFLPCTLGFKVLSSINPMGPDTIILAFPRQTQVLPCNSGGRQRVRLFLQKSDSVCTPPIAQGHYEIVMPGAASSTCYFYKGTYCRI
jgi:hypothetical protein